MQPITQKVQMSRYTLESQYHLSTTTNRPTGSHAHGPVEIISPLEMIIPLEMNIYTIYAH